MRKSYLMVLVVLMFLISSLSHAVNYLSYSVDKDDEFSLCEKLKKQAIKGDFYASILPDVTKNGFANSLGDNFQNKVLGKDNFLIAYRKIVEERLASSSDISTSSHENMLGFEVKENYKDYDCAELLKDIDCSDTYLVAYGLKKATYKKLPADELEISCKSGADFSKTKKRLDELGLKVVSGNKYLVFEVAKLSISKLKELPKRVTCKAEREYSNYIDLLDFEQLMIKKLGNSYMVKNFDFNGDLNKFTLVSNDFTDRASIIISCQSENGLEVPQNFEFDPSKLIPWCNAVSSGTCLEGYGGINATNGTDPEKTSYSTTLGFDFYPMFRFMVRNLDNKIGELDINKASSDLSVNIKNSLDASGVTAATSKSFIDIDLVGKLPLGFIEDDKPQCRFAIASADSSSLRANTNNCSAATCSAPVAPTLVEPGKITISLVLDGTPSWQRLPLNVKWTGVAAGNDVHSSIDLTSVNGVVDKNISATVTTKSGKIISCSVKIRAVEIAGKVNLNRGGACKIFSHLKYYYLMKQDGKKYVARRDSDDFELDTTSYFLNSLKNEFPGIDISKVYKDNLDIPLMKGWANMAIDTSGKAKNNEKGDLLMPSISNRRVNGGIILAYKYDEKTEKVDIKCPYFEAKVTDPNQGVIKFQKVVKQGCVYPKLIADGDTFIFRAFLTTDMATNDFMPFVKANSGEYLVSDFVVPFTGESCSPLEPDLKIPFKSPSQKQTDIWNSMAGLEVCAYTQPYSYKHINQGQINLNILYTTPENIEGGGFFAKFPTNMLSQEQTKPCVDDGSPKEKCWMVDKSQLPPSMKEGSITQKISEDHQSCQEMKVTSVNATDNYGRKITVRRVVKTFKNGCQVLEIADSSGGPDQECSQNLAFRFSGYSMMMMSALGCAAKYDADGVAVSPTLRYRGIIPYKTDADLNKFTSGIGVKKFAEILVDLLKISSVATNIMSKVDQSKLIADYTLMTNDQFNALKTALHGQVEKVSDEYIKKNKSTSLTNYQGYISLAAIGAFEKDTTLIVKFPGVNGVADFGGSEPKEFSKYDAGSFPGGEVRGYACIPCRFAEIDKDKDGKVDIAEDLSGTTAPISVDQEMASSPRQPIYTFTKEEAFPSCIRQTSVEVRYFGSSVCNNVKGKLPAGHFCSSGNLSPRNCGSSEGGAGGNIAGKFKIPMCPTSGFALNNISVSWSPLMLDLTGNGILISRSAKRAVRFDITGNRRKELIDWPENIEDVAFLVIPRGTKKNLRVTSIKQMFGDYKAKNGFKALAVYDKNKDGVIDKKDRVFKKLRLWIDGDRDGKSTPSEIKYLSDYGVELLLLKYRKSFLLSGAESETLVGQYFNRFKGGFMKMDDIYFNQWGKSKKRIKKIRRRLKRK